MHKLCLCAEGVGIGNVRMFGIAALGMPECLALRIGNVKMPGIALPMGLLNARGVGIGNDSMPGIAALGMPECLALRHWE